MLEQIVRPFTAPNPVSDRRSVVTKPIVAVPQTSFIEWGAAGQAPTVRTLGFKIVDLNKKKHRETSRETHKVRIENPDDPTQHIEEERIDKIEFAGKVATPTTSGPSGQSSGVAENTGFSTNGDSIKIEGRTLTDGDSINDTNPLSRLAPTPAKQDEINTFTLNQQ